jgi:hypothetical protein
MILLFSSKSNTSPHVPKEIERAVSAGVTIIPFRIEDVMPAKSLDYFIGSVHWLDALTPPLEQLAQNVRTLLSRDAAVIERGAGSSPSFWTCLQDLSPEPRGENGVDDCLLFPVLFCRASLPSGVGASGSTLPMRRALQ